MIADHLNLTGTTPLLGSGSFVDMTNVYSRAWRATFADAAGRTGIKLHEGVYVGMLGPQYETPAISAELRQRPRTLPATLASIHLSYPRTIRCRAAESCR